MRENNQNEERRKFKRLRLKFSLTVIYSKDQPLDVRIRNGVKEYRATMLDISEGGMSIITDINIPILTVLMVKFTLARVEKECVDFYGMLEIRGEVRYSIPLETGSYRLGICFLEINDKYRRDINNFMEVIEKHHITDGSK